VTSRVIVTSYLTTPDGRIVFLIEPGQGRLKLQEARRLVAAIVREMTASERARDRQGPLTSAVVAGTMLASSTILLRRAQVGARLRCTIQY
jgi:hypothetical protein